MATSTYPDARLTAQGEVVSFEGDVPLPNYVGPVYASFGGRPYILWAFPKDGEMAWERKWEVINAGSVIVQSALDQFIKENSTNV